MGLKEIFGSKSGVTNSTMKLNFRIRIGVMFYRMTDQFSNRIRHMITFVARMLRVIGYFVIE